jgi:hypothetical protein
LKAILARSVSPLQRSIIADMRNQLSRGESQRRPLWFSFPAKHRRGHDEAISPW